MGKTGVQTSAKDRASQLDDPGRPGAAWNPMSSSCQPTGSGKQPNLCSKEEPLALHFPYSLLLFSAVPFLKACFHIFRSLMLQANHGCTSESRTKTNHRPLLLADFPLLGLQSRPPVLHLSRSPYSSTSYTRAMYLRLPRCLLPHPPTPPPPHSCQNIGCLLATSPLPNLSGELLPHEIALGPSSLRSEGSLFQKQL